jgi:hypothetical protein
MSSQERNAVRDQVLAVVGLELARAERKAADALVKAESTVNHAGNWAARAQRERTHRVAQYAAEIWADVHGMVMERLSDGMQADSGSAEQPAPERTVAWSIELKGHHALVCNRNSECRRWYTDVPSTPVPLTSADLPHGGLCEVCGTDVLA